MRILILLITLLFGLALNAQDKREEVVFTTDMDRAPWTS